MDFTEFNGTLVQDTPPHSATGPLLALWLDGRGRWADAHRVVQAENDPESARVHAYLHRVEGDLDNARYWYAQAGVEESTVPLEEEWQLLVLRQLNKPGVTES